jgi:hypothetical protein
VSANPPTYISVQIIATETSTDFIKILGRPGPSSTGGIPDHEGKIALHRNMRPRIPAMDDQGAAASTE